MAQSRLRLRTKIQSDIPPHGAVDLFYDASTGVVKVIDHENNPVAIGTSSTSTIIVEPSNGSAAAGELGEYVSSVTDPGTAVSLPNNTATNITSISLTAGDWDVEGNIVFINTGSTVTQREGCINTTSATRLADGTAGFIGNSGTDPIGSIAFPRKRISLSSTTTVYLVGFALHGGGTMSGYGALTARRVR